MRTQNCREKIDWIVENCPIGDDAKREIKKAAEFCEVHPEISGLSSHAIQPLIREKDKEVKELAIPLVKSLLQKETPSGKKVYKKLTEKQVREVIDKARKEIHPTPCDTPPSDIVNVIRSAAIEDLRFPALICPTCIEVRNHRCTVNTDCPVCGAKLVSVVLKVERVI